MLPPPKSIVVRALASLASGVGGERSLLILIFHRVLPTRDPMLPSEPDATVFANLVRLFTQNFNVLRLSDAIERLRNRSLPRRALCITFDDGYANNFEVALPILKSMRAPACVFVAPGFLNGGRMFNDTIIEALRRAPEHFDLRAEGLGELSLGDSVSRLRAVNEVITALKHREPAERWALAERIAKRCGATLPDDLMMTDAQVRKLHAAGIEIGAHTMTHPILTRIDDVAARKEMADSKTYLEGVLGSPVTSFAYPNGRPHQDYAAAHVRLAQECGFDFALSTAWGAATAQANYFQLPRIAPWDASLFRYATRMALGYRQHKYTIV